MAAALEVISRDMLKGSGVLGDRVSAVEKTANEALSTANKVDNGVPLLINDQKKREKELWDFCRSELCRSGWFEERLNRLATAVDQKPDEARVKMLLRKSTLPQNALRRRRRFSSWSSGSTARSVASSTGRT